MNTQNPQPLISDHASANVQNGKEGKFPDSPDASHRTVEFNGKYGPGIWVRHGAYLRSTKLSEEESDGRLTEEGIATMIKSATVLAQYLPTFITMVVAPRERNRHSAEILKEELAKHNVFVTTIVENEMLTQQNYTQCGKYIWQKLSDIYKSPHAYLLIAAQPCISMNSTQFHDEEFRPDFGEAMTAQGHILTLE